jgi:hypothetical protein
VGDINAGSMTDIDAGALGDKGCDKAGEGSSFRIRLSDMILRFGWQKKERLEFFMLADDF